MQYLQLCILSFSLKITSLAFSHSTKYWKPHLNGIYISTIVFSNNLLTVRHVYECMYTWFFYEHEVLDRSMSLVRRSDCFWRKGPSKERQHDHHEAEIRARCLLVPQWAWTIHQNLEVAPSRSLSVIIGQGIGKQQEQSLLWHHSPVVVPGTLSHRSAGSWDNSRGCTKAVDGRESPELGQGEDFILRPQ